MSEYPSPWKLPKLGGLLPAPVRDRKLKPEVNPIIAGTRFALLTTTGLKKRGDDERQKMRYQCRCDCGSLKYVLKAHLLADAIGSCGCRRGVHVGAPLKEILS